MKLYTPLMQYVNSLELKEVQGARKELLTTLIDYLKTTRNPQLNFICTHNSRRSHLSQIWAQTMADFYGVSLQTYSGGTEVTAFHPNAVSALKRAGFRIEKGVGSNPRYQIRYSDHADSLVCYSKTYDDSANPSADFAAVMTCSDADGGCPVVTGATQRIRLFYEDPKVSDGTDQEEKIYDDRCRQIATEMKFVFSSLS